MRIFNYLFCAAFCLIHCKSDTSAPRFTTLEVRQFIESVRDPSRFNPEADSALGTLKKYLNWSIPILTEKDTGIAFLYHKIGQHYYNKTTHSSKNFADSSLYHYNKAYQIRLEILGAQHWLTCKTLLNTAIVLRNFKEDVVESEKILGQALQIDSTYDSETAEPMLKAHILYQLADCATQLDRYDDATHWYELALQHYHAVFDKYPKQEGDWNKDNYINTCNNLIQTYNDLGGKTNQAIQLYRQTFQKWQLEAEPDSTRLGDLYFAHALSQRNLKQYKLFFKFIQLSTELYESQNDFEFVANNHLEIAKTHLELQQYDTAIGYAQRAYDSLQSHDYPTQHHRVREACILFGNIHKAQGNWKIAKDWYEKAIGDALQNRFDPQQLEPLLGQSDVLEQVKDYENNYIICQKIDKLIQQMTHSFKTDFSKVHFSEITRSFYEKAIKNANYLYQKHKNQKYFDAIIQFTDAQKSVLLSEQLLREEKLTHLGVPSPVIEAGKQLRVALKKANESLQKETDVTQILALQTQLNQLYERNEQYLRQLEKDYPRYSQLKFNTLPIKTDAIRKDMQPQMVVIQYFWGQDTLTTTVLSPKHGLVFTMPLTTEFKNRVTQFRKQIVNKNIAFNGENAKQLYQDLLKNPLDSLQKMGFSPQSLVLIPDDSLSYMAFEALKPNATQYLVQQYDAISYEYSAKSWVQNHRKKNDFVKNSVSMLALAEDYQGIAPTDASKTLMGKKVFAPLNVVGHAQSLISTFSNSLFRQTSILPKKKLLDSIKIKNPKIIHFSGHGYRHPNTPIESGVLLDKGLDSNQVWTAKNVYEMTLVQTQLIYLMACSTAEGVLQTGEGVQSMARAFFYAGAPRVISGLWEIPEVDAKNITTYFYDFVKQHNVAQAITHSKKDYLSKYKGTNQHPNHWAGLILIGNPNSLEMK